MIHLGIANMAINNFFNDMIFFSNLMLFIVMCSFHCSVFLRTATAFVVLVKFEVMYVGLR
jgi:hypothetical protein